MPPHAHPDAESEAVAALEEIIADLGIRAVLAASLKTEIGERLATSNSQGMLRVIQFIIREIAFAKNARLQAEVIALGYGIVLSDDDTMTRLAAKHGLTRAAVSARVIKFCDAHALPPSIHMKSKRARKTYALTNQPKR